MGHILLGIKDALFTSFISCITNHLVSHPTSSLGDSLELLWLLALQAHWPDTGTLFDTQYMHALLHAQSFWKRLVSAIGIPGYLNFERVGDYGEDELFGDFTRLIYVCTSYTSSLASDKQGWGDVAICEAFIKVLIRAGIIDAMEYLLLSRGDKNEDILGELF